VKKALAFFAACLLVNAFFALLAITALAGSTP